jgi:hypothetical protein
VTRGAKVLWALAAAGLLAMVLAVLAFAGSTIPSRIPYWGEAEVVFEASRLRDGLPLFVDPLAGAREHGEPPSRFYVTYPPLWAAVLSLAPASAALVVSRVLGTLAWLGALFGMAWTARRGSRVTTAACAAFVFGSWVLANFATTGRPDAIACALAAAGLVRAMRVGRIDGVALVLLVLVPWVKPTLLGLPAGALVADALARRDARTIGHAAATTLGIAAALHFASGGALFAHVALSNAQPFTLQAWLEHVPSRLPFFLPLFALAGVVGWRDRESPGTRVGLGALAGSVAWTLIALAKTGSASNYWMEPCIAAVAVIAQAAPGPRPFAFGRGPALHALLALGAVLYAGVASVRASVEHAREYRDDARFVATVRALCGEGAIAADEAGIELVTNGRILVPTYQMVHLVNAGRFPAALWIADLRAARCVVEHTGQLRLSPEISRALDERFPTRLERGSFRVLTRLP